LRLLLVLLLRRISSWRSLRRLLVLLLGSALGRIARLLGWVSWLLGRVALVALRRSSILLWLIRSLSVLLGWG
jgi:hypothetical protein